MFDTYQGDVLWQKAMQTISTMVAVVLYYRFDHMSIDEMKSFHSVTIQSGSTTNIIVDIDKF